MLNNVEFYLEKLFDLYKVGSVAELSKAIDTDQKRISNWKTRNSINALKKRMRELGIYNEIFGDLNNNVQRIESISGGQVAQNVQNQVMNESQNNEVDKNTLGLFHEAYEKAISKDDLKGLRLHLMDY